MRYPVKVDDELHTNDNDAQLKARLISTIELVVKMFL